MCSFLSKKEILSGYNIHTKNKLLLNKETNWKIKSDKMEMQKECLDQEVRKDHFDKF
jgi:hypothetical protein